MSEQDYYVLCLRAETPTVIGQDAVEGRSPVRQAGKLVEKINAEALSKPRTRQCWLSQEILGDFWMDLHTIFKFIISIFYVYILLSLIAHNILLRVLATLVTPERMFSISGI